MDLPRHVLVVGFRRTGQAVAAALAARGVHVRVADARLVGVPRGAPVLAAAIRRGIPVRSEIEVAAGLLCCPLVAVTGTNGKSTVTTLVGLALAPAGRRAFGGGNLGPPLLPAAA